MIKNLSIRYHLPLLIVAPSVLVVGLIAIILFQRTRQNINIVSVELARTTTANVEDNLRDYLSVPNTINQLNLQSIALGALNLDDLTNLELYFWNQIQIFEGVKSLYFGNPQGEFRGATILNSGEVGISIAGQVTNSSVIRYATTSDGRKTEIVHQVANYDPRIRPWYQAALQSNKPIWTDIYQDFSAQELAITAAQVVKDSQGEILGVLAVDLFFQGINQFLQDLTIGKTGQVLIINREGVLIASSNPDLIAEAQRNQDLLNIVESENELISAIAENLLNQFGSFFRLESTVNSSLTWNRKHVSVQVKSFRDRLGLDWLIVVIIPEEDFMQQVAIQAWITFVLELLILLSSLGIGLGVSRWVLQPIFQFSEAADQIKSQSFNPQTLENLYQRQDEVGELARVFVDMAVETGDRQQSLQDELNLLNFQVSQSNDNPYELTALKKWQKKASCIRTVYDYHPHLPQLLSQVPYYQHLTPEQLSQLVMEGKIKRVEVGDYICREDQPGDEFYIILTGSVRIFVEKINKPLVILSSGQSFGELALMLGGNRTATAIAIEETTLFLIDRLNFGKVLHQYPQMAEQIAQDLHRHQTELQERKQLLAEYGLLEDDETDLLQQIKSRMKILFNL
ncbi:MAG: cyclic nucleotide-binding domain-containing protein [Roseofilum sp. SID2]|uniref:cache domain-containing protein n=1 Tax=unclassified Roseofilum TaxID=2620099 RepID=UPI001B1E9657|nr:MULTISPECIES: cache domain-containing protein [unclassified Roseofilum]MBP0012101.1 cyclic nucleotide-binding domain-containing protein [Roseofilum sp. SID3]MBP0023905.1 cyclic nucleotide-binding domain-containing protein [Roseofilum sp. SID2]